MKKIISAVLAASMTLSASSIVLGAESRTAEYKKIFDADTINIIYNDKLVEYEDVTPINTEGRVMIPFRSMLETVGASVNYDDDAKLVTASKGDTTIKFTLLDDTIYIDKDGEESQITMDVPMIVSEDRVFVPIRFMSNALGMQVGWEGDTETVFVVDIDEYADEIAASIPSLTKLINAEQLNKNSKSTVDFVMDYSGTDQNGADMDFAVSGKMEDRKAGGAEELVINADVSSDSYNLKLEDAKMDAVLDGTVIYVKTNVIGQLLSSRSGAAAAMAAMLTSDETWYKLDMLDILRIGRADENTVELFGQMLKYGSDIDVEAVAKSFVAADGDVNADQVMSLAIFADMLEMLDKYIVIEETENGIKAELSMTQYDLVDIAGAVMGTDEEVIKNTKETLKDTLSADIKLSSEISSDKAVSSIGINLNDPTGSFKADIKEVSEKDDDEVSIEIPESAIDIMPFLSGFVNN